MLDPHTVFNVACLSAMVVLFGGGAYCWTRWWELRRERLTREEQGNA